MTTNDCRVLELSRFHDGRGNLTFAENNAQVPFEIKRAYWIYDVPAGESRGAHAHRNLEQFIVAMSGSFRVTVDDGTCRRSIVLDRPDRGLYVSPGIWCELDGFSSGAVCMVLASELFIEEDYICDYDEFIDEYSIPVTP